MPASTIRKTGTIYLVRDVYRPNVKVEITRSDGTVDNVSSYILSLSITRAVNVGVDNFTMKLANPLGTHIGKWTGGETINIWLDFDDASTKQFNGIVEAPFFQFNTGGHVLSLEGRSSGWELLEVHATESYTNQDAADIADDLITNYATNVTYSSSPTGVSIEEIDLEETPVFDGLKDVFERASHDFYIDTSSALQHFAENSVTNTTDMVVHGMNLLDCNIGVDIREVKNRVRNYGAAAESSTDVIILATKENTSSQTTYGLREEISNNNNLRSYEAVEGEAETLLITSPTQHGDFRSIGLPTIQPGQLLRISSPYDNVVGYYRIVEFTHTYNIGSGFITSGVVEKQRPVLEDKFKELFKFKQQNRTSKNPNKMKYTYLVKFDGSESISHSNTEITNSTLKVVSGENTGEATIATYDTPEEFTDIELRIHSEDLGNSTIYISNDAGVTEKSANANEVVVFNDSGDKLRIRIAMNKDSLNPDPKIFTLGVMYK